MMAVLLQSPSLHCAHNLWVLLTRTLDAIACCVQVEPFQRSLNELDVDVMINGRRRDHGFERAQLEVRSDVLLSKKACSVCVPCWSSCTNATMSKVVGKPLCHMALIEVG